MDAEGVPSKILFLALTYSDTTCQSSLYTELVEELSIAGSDIRVVAPAQDNSRKGLFKEGGIYVLRVVAGELYEVSLLQKALNNLLLPIRYFFALRRHNRTWHPDWIITPTPPITLAPLVWWLKRRTGARAYLVLRDIFPQNAVDLGLISCYGPVFAFFRLLEKCTYDISDRIGCMSPANIKYLQGNNAGLDAKKLHLLPNWIAERHVGSRLELPKCIRRELGVKDDDLLCIFGGNLGKPQQVSFLVDVAEELRHERNIRIIVVGSGTERSILQEQIKVRQINSLVVLDRLARSDYQKLLSAADVGFILLNQHFTIPNIPSRLMDYWAAGVAVLAATDTATDLDEAFLSKYGGGDWVKMGDVEAFAGKLRSYVNCPEILNKMGGRGKKAVCENFTAKRAAEVVLNQMALAVR